MKWHPRLDRIEQELARRKRRQADAPAIIIVVPDAAAGHPRIDGKTCMLESDAARLSDELTARGERLPCFVHFGAEYLDL